LASYLYQVPGVRKKTVFLGRTKNGAFCKITSLELSKLVAMPFGI